MLQQKTNSSRVLSPTINESFNKLDSLLDEVHRFSSSIVLSANLETEQLNMQEAKQVMKTLDVKQQDLMQNLLSQLRAEQKRSLKIEEQH